jgi:hypothetical protein
MISYLKIIAEKIGIDRSVAYGFLTSIRAFIVGPIAALLIAYSFSPEVQGFYYTFLSLLSFQIFVELGLGIVIVQFVSHEWAQLKSDEQGRITGSPEALSRLICLGRYALRWYSIAGGIFAIAMGAAGYCFFSQAQVTGINWVGPWFTLCCVTGIKLCYVPLGSLLEGANKIVEIYRYRFVDGMLTSLTVCVAIVWGAKLWTPVLATVISLAWGTFYFAVRNRHFFLTFFSRPSGPTIHWRREVWPMQWRIALSWIVGFFITNLFTPVLFHYHGAIVAGQMGMTWNMVNALAAVSLLCVNVKAPRFGVLIANKEFQALDNLFFRVTATSIFLIIIGILTAWILVYLLYSFDFPLARRLLPPLPTALFLLAQAATLATAPFSTYLRAHKREPYLALSIISGVLIGLSTLLLGRKYGATGIATGYLIISSVFSLPYALFIWNKCRLQWHRI